ncbi:MAG TPA: SMC family ATPase [Fimbriimonadaceae bacterium]|nr:SMC family ATPase [Fimbriimonadaceae bacterium]HRJ32623.1 SMC family ATPase [Fimbriimonadaceae bacterium]
MKLKRLRLENFRQHRATEIFFEEGMTAILGTNGSGKTTLLEAIGYALFNKQRGNQDSLIPDGEPEAKPAVELDFSLGERHFELRRGAKVWLREVEGGETRTIAENSKPVEAAVRRLVGMTYKHFINSFCAQQKGLAFLGGESDDSRQKEIARMLRLDRLDQAAKIAKDTANDLSRKVEGMEKTASSVEETAQEMKDAEMALDQEKQLQAGATKELEALKKKQADLAPQQARIQEYFNLVEQQKELRLHGKEARAKRDGLEEQVQALTADENRRIEIQEKFDQYQKLAKQLSEQNALRALDAEEQKNNARRDLLQDQIKTKEKERPAPPARTLAELQAEVHDRSDKHQKAVEAHAKAKLQLETELSIARSQQQALKQQLDQDQEWIDKGQCPTCEQPIGPDFAKKFQSKQNQGQELARQIEGLEQKKKAAEAEPAEILELKKDLEEAIKAEQQAAKHQMWFEEIEALRDQLKQLPAPSSSQSRYDPELVARIQSELPSLEAIHTEYVQIQGRTARADELRKNLMQAEGSFQKLKEKAQVLQKQLDELGWVSKDEVEEAQRRLIELDARIGQEQAKLDVQARSLKSLSDRLEKARQAQLNAQNHAAEIRAERRMARHYTLVAKGLAALRKELNNRLVPDLQARASDHLSRLSDGRYSELRLDAKFSPTVLDDDFEKAVLSGGEEDIVALALRLALSELIQERVGQPMSLLILDEVFGSLDESRRVAVLNLLSAMKGTFSQILVISHIDEIHQVADQCLYVQLDLAERRSSVSDQPPGFVSAGLG